MGYRYSTSGFYTLSDTMYKHMDGYEFNDGDDEDTPMWSRYYNLFYTKRGKLQVNISQQLGEYGSFYLSGSQQTYWHTDQQDRLLQFGYNTQIKISRWGFHGTTVSPVVNLMLIRCLH